MSFFFASRISPSSCRNRFSELVCTWWRGMKAWSALPSPILIQKAVILVIVGMSGCCYEWPVYAAGTAEERSQLPEPTSTVVAARSLLPEEENKFRPTVLKYIDKLPMAESKKERLREVISQAKEIARLLTVPFENAITKVDLETLAKIKTQLAQPRVQEWLKDPALVLVVLGFGDHRGTEADRMRGFEPSALRIQSVVSLLRDECDVQTILYSIPMGRMPEDPDDYYKTHVVEVWSIR
jgi:hypothetical protein